eukprot:TRINITY_DN5456_c0_g2_i8.p1 TRINITY_DN5456_c0_g2~~TRINITY_DN5456_c0_g2_i8.p1  ORF type:complete len:125 (+),score=14.18 TRINITY_DN5456_c0_g2_i8:656-1030(+)
MLKELDDNEKLAELNCGHKVLKDRVIHSALHNFEHKMLYCHRCWRAMCGKAIELKNIQLECGCIWSNFSKKVEVIDEFNYGKCEENKPLSIVDLCLINDHISFKFTLLMLSEYTKDKTIRYIIS